MNPIKIACRIKLKPEVLDTKGRAVLKLVQKENPAVKDLHYGKYIELEIDQKDEKKALKEAEILAQNILHNDLIETFDLEVLK